MSDVEAEALVVDGCVLCVLWVLVACRGHESTKRALNLDHRYGSLVYVMHVRDPLVGHLSSQTISNSPQSILDPRILHGRIDGLLLLTIRIGSWSHHEINVRPMKAEPGGMRSIYIHEIVLV